MENHDDPQIIDRRSRDCRFDARGMYDQSSQPKHEPASRKRFKRLRR
ncbi:hypothetical protein AOX55_00002156 [Sinorhizobium fredii CCBAU 25509]|nr:hypothetical protein AOX55_00002156 [Sinorhizobium fredii CCBAU 25509]